MLSTSASNASVPYEQAGPANLGLVAKGGVLATWMVPIANNCENGTVKTMEGITMECPSQGMNCTDGCLFDLEADEGETNDLAKDPGYADILAGMMAKLKKYQQPYDPATKEGLFKPIRNGANELCAPGGEAADICGDDYCSDDPAAYAEGCDAEHPCEVCPPGTPDCKTTIRLKGCTSKAFCKRITEDTGFYTWALEKNPE